MDNHINNFEALVKSGRYIDQTHDLEQLTHGHCVSLSRPDGFGKTTLLDTLECLYTGRADLFAGTAAEQLALNTEPHPVLRFTLTNAIGSEEDYDELMDRQLRPYEQQYHAGFQNGWMKDCGFAMRLKDILQTAHELTGKRCVVLVDDYDVPIFRAADPGNMNEYKTPRYKLWSGMMADFCIFKSCDAEIELVLLTCQVQILLANVFGGFNNVFDISYYWRTPHLCALQRDDILRDRKPELEKLATNLNLDIEQTLDQLARWYGGYYYYSHRQDRVESLNLRSVLRALDEGHLDNYLAEIEPLRYWSNVVTTTDWFGKKAKPTEGVPYTRQFSEAYWLRCYVTRELYTGLHQPIEKVRGHMTKYLVGCGLLAQDIYDEDPLEGYDPLRLPNIEAVALVNDRTAPYKLKPVELLFGKKPKGGK